MRLAWTAWAAGKQPRATPRWMRLDKSERLDLAAVTEEGGAMIIDEGEHECSSAKGAASPRRFCGVDEIFRDGFQLTVDLETVAALV